MKISVVIPVLNERESLPATIAALRACRGSAESLVLQSSTSQNIASQGIASQNTVSQNIVSEIIV